MNTQTPRTDSQNFFFVEAGYGITDTAVDVEFARALERELNEANERIIALRAALEWALPKAHLLEQPEPEVGCLPIYNSKGYISAKEALDNSKTIITNDIQIK